MICSISLPLPRPVSVLGLRVNCVSVSSTPHSTQSTHLRTVSQFYDALFVFTFFFSPVHFYSIRSKSSALSCRAEHDYCSGCSAENRQNRKLRLAHFYDTKQAMSTRPNAIVASSTQSHTTRRCVCVSVIRIRPFLGRRTEPTTLTSAVE